jgi:ribosome-binding factor A
MLKRKAGSASPSKRPLRVASEVKRDLPEIIRLHVSLPAGVLVSITDVELSSDLSFAKIYFSVFGGTEEVLGQKIADLLNSKKSAIRTELAQRLVMRKHPELRFYYDSTPVRAARIEMLFKQIHDEHDGEKDGENS